MARLPPATRDVKTIADALANINMDDMKEKFPTVDVDEVWERFSQACKEGIASDPRPNPYKYRDFNKAFQNWLRKEKRGGNRPRPTATTQRGKSWRDF